MSFMHERKAELSRAKEGKPGGAAGGGLDLSNLKPTPAQLPDPDVDAAVQQEARARGFDRTVGASAPDGPPSPRARAQAGSKAGRKRGREGEGAVKPVRYTVSHKERPPADIQGQAVFSGDARVLYEICRRAHYERRPRVELLADMLELYEKTHGPTPDY